MSLLIAAQAEVNLQANPTRDVMDYAEGDGRYLSPKIDASDALHLLAATVAWLDAA